MLPIKSKENHQEVGRGRLNKVELKRVLHLQGRLAIAYSGGVDSTLLLMLGLETLGPENILVLHASSSMQAADERRRACIYLQELRSKEGITVEMLELDPLTWESVVKNNPDRCYLCKTRMYILFLEVMQRYGFSTLADGTNVDDLQQERPGLRALRELQVQTPLVEAGLTKHDVRCLSRTLGLPTWNVPSSSCLATRIPHGLEITADRLERISNWETYLHKLGFAGCRVRMDKKSDSTVYIEIPVDDMERFVRQTHRLPVSRYFQSIGINLVYLNLAGR